MRILEPLLLLAAVGVAYVGQVRGQASWHWLAGGLLAALIAAWSISGSGASWDAVGRHVPVYLDQFTVVTVCLVHTSRPGRPRH
ncbi:hypothetical protein [Herbihabitans rhizosphaerae]|uniref:hypothetical protein n=1 Tax=Herbihabitans rhizosphaerae TaxID=1872711 RepID=UPI00102CCE5F|nr:hypothetical protein [Herbihabitans rhizosphaerae]